MSERDRSRRPDLEVFDRDVDWPAPQPDPVVEPVHQEIMPLDDAEDLRWR
jgi:hypothetical protein